MACVCATTPVWLGWAIGGYCFLHEQRAKENRLDLIEQRCAFPPCAVAAADYATGTVSVEAATPERVAAAVTALTASLSASRLTPDAADDAVDVRAFESHLTVASFEAGDAAGDASGGEASPGTPPPLPVLPGTPIYCRTAFGVCGLCVSACECSSVWAFRVNAPPRRPFTGILDSRRPTASRGTLRVACNCVACSCMGGCRSRVPPAAASVPPCL